MKLMKQKKNMRIILYRINIELCNTRYSSNYLISDKKLITINYKLFVYYFIEKFWD